MLGLFADLLPGEVLYSAFARYSDRMNYDSRVLVTRGLHNGKKFRAIIDLPGHLNDFLESLPPAHLYTAEELIDNHTLLPYYTPFLPAERVGRLRREMISSEKPYMNVSIGKTASNTRFATTLKLCLQCAEEDRISFGESYWHRIYQAPGVEICPTHKTLLWQTAPLARDRHNYFKFISAEKALRDKTLVAIDVGNIDHQILVELARNVEWILNQKALSESFASLRNRYLNILIQSDLALYTGTVRLRKLENRFKEFYPQNLLKLLNCPLDEYKNETWLARLFRNKGRVQHPLHHLLLMQFLGYTAQEFWGGGVDLEPFGKGPWPCLSPVCEKRLQLTISSYKLTYNKHKKLPTAIFACECGFTYSRLGPEKEAAERYQISRIVKFGAVWENTLRDLWQNPEITFTKLCQILQVNRLTVSRHAQRLNLPFPRPGSRSLFLNSKLYLSGSKEAAKQLSKKESFRKEWHLAVEKYPELGVTDLRAKFPPVYRWLLQHDSDWLKLHLPPRKKGTKLGRIDWSSRDKELALQVRAAALELKHLPGKPLYLNKTALGRMIGQVGLIKNNLENLPLTRAALGEVVETFETYCLRRIDWACLFYEEAGSLPPRWQLIRKAGIEETVKSSVISTQIKAYLASKLSQFQE